MKEIPLSQGKIALVNDEDFDWLNQWKWYAREDGRTFYALRRARGQKAKVLMHREILGLKTGDKRAADHCNRDGLDNRRTNLRIATPRENARNRSIAVTNSSGVRGVHWYTRDQRWFASIRLKGHRMFLGCFDDKNEAAAARKKAEQQYFGEFAPSG